MFYIVNEHFIYRYKNCNNVEFPEYIVVSSRDAESLKKEIKFAQSEYSMNY